MNKKETNIEDTHSLKNEEEVEETVEEKIIKKEISDKNTIDSSKIEEIEEEIIKKPFTFKIGKPLLGRDKLPDSAKVIEGGLTEEQAKKLIEEAKRKEAGWRYMKSEEESEGGNE